MKTFENAILGALLAGCLWGAEAAVEDVSFRAAEPVWPEGRTERSNDFVGFRSNFVVSDNQRPTLRITASTIYRVWVNGQFAGHGPVRAGNGHARMDEWPLADLVRPGTNVVAVEVSAFNLTTISFTIQPAFLQAEVVAGDRVLCATGRDFAFVELPRLKNVSRYSRMRAFHEVYRIAPDWADWRTDVSGAGSVPARCPAVRIHAREVAYPDFAVRPGMPISTTAFAFDLKSPKKDPKLEFDGWDALARLKDVRTQPLTTVLGMPQTVAAGKGILLDFGFNDAGFLGCSVVCREPGTLYLLTDEKMTDGHLDPLRRYRVPSMTVWQLTQPGVYHLEAFEPTSFRYVHAFMSSGRAEVSGCYIRTYKNPESYAASFESDDPRLDALFAAARETNAQNTMDATMDCPSRERNSCPCDAYFTLAATRLLAGNFSVERVFVGNYAQPDVYPPDHPKELLPTFYPGRRMSVIPNWTLFFIVQLDRYVRETGDRCAADRMRERILSSIAYLRTFRNSDGLLEKLPYIVFVSWDKANSFVQDVNYPSNMLWAETLDALNRLYRLPDCADEAKRVRETVRKQSWNGTWFRDHAVRQGDGTLKVCDECTETCQYFAFYFGIATPTNHAALWKRLVEEFGPDRVAAGRHLEISPSETYVGLTMRLDLLSRYGCDEVAVENARGWFGPMADVTGTLWEGLDERNRNTCCHGYASFVANVLATSALGVREIDARTRRVTLRAPDRTKLTQCRGSFPTVEGPIVYGWKRVNGTLQEEVCLPPGWTRARAPDHNDY